jgi:hypothetical protein
MQKMVYVKNTYEIAFLGSLEIKVGWILFVLSVIIGSPNLLSVIIV